MHRLNLDTVLVVLASLGIFAVFDIIGHKDAPYFWVKLLGVLALSILCMLATRDREAWDIFFGIIAALFALCAIAMTTAYRNSPNWWTFFLTFAGVAMFSVLLTRRKRAISIGIAAIVGFRFFILVILYALHR